jgi:predicted acylesterase/phospholipase RssA
MENYDTIVLSGSSVNSLVTLGSLHFLYENDLVNNVNTFIGTSSGSIISFLLAISYTPLEILTYISINRTFHQFINFDAVSAFRGGGATPYTFIQETLEKMTIAKIKTLPTLIYLKEKLGKILICSTYNVTSQKVEYLSYENYPDLPCLTAIRMSSNLPIIFENFDYNSCLYTDGVIADNFPIQLADSNPSYKKIIGIWINKKTNTQTKSNNDITNNTMEFIYTMISELVNQNTKYKIDRISKKSTILELTYNTLSFFNFNITSQQILNMFSEGYLQTKKMHEPIEHTENTENTENTEDVKILENIESVDNVDIKVVKTEDVKIVDNVESIKLK